MKLLLDTHTLFWAAAEPRKLSPRARLVLGDPDNELFVSSVSAVELAIKTHTGKLPGLGIAVLTFWQTALPTLRAVELPLLGAHGAEVELLPRHHKDPFDWMLIAQARVENMPIVTDDDKMPLYDVELIW